MLILPPGRGIYKGNAQRIATDSDGDGRDTFIDFRRGPLITQVGWAGTEMTVSGATFTAEGLVFDGTSTHYCESNTGFAVSNSSGFKNTSICMVTWRGVGSADFGRIFECDLSGTANDAFVYFRTSTPQLAWRCGHSTTQAESFTPEVGATYIFFLVQDSNVKQLHWGKVGGRLYSSSTAGSVTNTSGSQLVFGNRAAHDRGIDATFHFYSNDKDVWETDRMARMLADPWRNLYRGANDPVFLTLVATGGTNYDETVAISASAAVAVTESYAAPAYDESAAIASTAAVTVTEAYSAGGFAESVAVTATATVAVTESYTAPTYDESVAVAASASVDVVESYTVGNEYAEQVAVSSAVAVTVTDSYTGPAYNEATAIAAAASVAVTESYAVASFDELVAISASAAITVTEGYTYTPPTFAESVAVRADVSISVTETATGVSRWTKIPPAGGSWNKVSGVSTDWTKL